MVRVTDAQKIQHPLLDFEKTRPGGQPLSTKYAPAGELCGAARLSSRDKETGPKVLLQSWRRGPKNPAELKGAWGGCAATVGKGGSLLVCVLRSPEGDGDSLVCSLGAP